MEKQDEKKHRGEKMTEFCFFPFFVHIKKGHSPFFATCSQWNSGKILLQVATVGKDTIETTDYEGHIEEHSL